MEKKKLYVILLDLALVISALAAQTVTGWMIRFIPDCPVMTMGLLCPACGGTRCVRYFFSGRFLDAFRVNPFFFLLILYLAGALALLNAGVLLNVQPMEKLARAMTGWKAVIAAAILFAVFGVMRNVL